MKELRLTEQSQDESALFKKITDTKFSATAADIIENHTGELQGIKSVLAVHWHPEFVPLESCLKRTKKMFPDAVHNLIIPTQHNEIMTLGRYSGVEVDCYSREFSRKVQLLLHFKDIKKERTSKLRSMIAHTFRYRGSQMHELLDALCAGSADKKALKGAEKCGAEKEVIEFTAVFSQRLKAMIEANGKSLDPALIKNKLIRNYFDELRCIYDPHGIDLCQIYIKAVKEEIKRSFSNEFFYGTRALIEEARHAGAGIVVPHPEQFWPVLMADYDVDGYEVWNPQSREYTEFLIDVVKRKNSGSLKRKLLVFMGDDTHMGEKTRPAEIQDKEKAEREIGYQPAWKDAEVKKMLSLSGFSKELTISEYESRL